MPTKTIILIKKKKDHAGHHGGAWKVAYADFVTALMALFIVLWLMNTNPSVRKAVAGYFNDPMGHTEQTGTDRSGAGDNMPVTKDNFKALKERLEQSIHQLNDLKSISNQISMTVTPEGLRIELLETKDGSFFDSGSAKLNERGREILALLAGELGKIPNRISIEGHTDAKPYPGGGRYDNWDLSTDRANAARRVMEATGLRPNQVSQVRGYADQMLRVPSNPFDPSNRRISLIVQYLNAAPPPVAAAQEIAAGKNDPPPPAIHGIKPPAAIPLQAQKSATAVTSGSFISKIFNSRVMQRMRHR